MLKARYKFFVQKGALLRSFVSSLDNKQESQKQLLNSLKVRYEKVYYSLQDRNERQLNYWMVLMRCLLPLYQTWHPDSKDLMLGLSEWIRENISYSDKQEIRKWFQQLRKKDGLSKELVHKGNSRKLQKSAELQESTKQ
eukprot:TRINITY_DN5808_c0_g1_i2.p2 TRINITY_DN5808_c0_g1~~TRINITY_DN5808_c0_g1_i2.p2  ORF type:complete len:147 (-),score=2.45 TRINITY_DN5808_c0_g1_i2:276-692(-)